MVSYLEFPIVIFTPATTREKIVGLFFAFVCFGPFVYGLISEHYVFCLSVPILFFISYLFEDVWNHKKTPQDKLREKDTIAFSEFGFEATDLGKIESFIWEDLHQIQINIISYKNKFRDEDSYYNGKENYISFMQNGVSKNYNFFINKEFQYNFVSDFFENKILPKLYQNKSIIQESIIISKLDYTNLQRFKTKNNINRYTDFIHYN